MSFCFWWFFNVFGDFLFCVLIKKIENFREKNYEIKKLSDGK
ncbi:putative signal peptide protein [Puccinia sorghi]|uniref:Putative signal peptide protein n=1 Tax=Puccinia sorghi TaxID=27349 RepID=A0A0L6UNW2_9BASI|nr:putative signal peptide protein [Puccinia sorghi]